MTARTRSRHGLRALKGRVSLRGLRAIDVRTAAGRSLKAWESELMDALGGEAALSPQKRALCQNAARLKLYRDHLDAHLMALRSLVTKRRSVVPVLRERMAIAASLERTLGLLGLNAAEPSIAEIMRDFHSKPASEPDDESLPPLPGDEDELASEPVDAKLEGEN